MHRVYGEEGRKLLAPILHQLHTRDRLNHRFKQASQRRQHLRYLRGRPYARHARRSRLTHYRKSRRLPGCRPLQPGRRKKLIVKERNSPQLVRSNSRHSKPPQLARSKRRIDPPA